MKEGDATMDATRAMEGHEEHLTVNACASPIRWNGLVGGGRSPGDHAETDRRHGVCREPRFLGSREHDYSIEATVAGSVRRR